MEAAAKVFFSSQQFAVAGASQNKSKFGYKIFAWYIQHSLPATPINPTSDSIVLPSSSHNTVSSISKLPEPAKTALSIITPPKVTKKILEEAKEAGIKAVWLQPGSFDDEGLNYAKEQFDAAVGGHGGVGGEGWCVLADGEDVLASIGRQWKRQKL